MEEEKETVQAERRTEDWSALDGLRGLASIHVMVGHFFGGDGSLSARLSMPLFYILSGFSLALGYGRSPWSGGLAPSICFSSDKQRVDSIQEGEGSFKKSLRFYQNRFARIAPIFLMTNMSAFYFYYNFFNLQFSAWRVFRTMTMTNCWFPFGIYMAPFNGVSWTVTTLTFFYLVFPVLFPCIQRLSTNKLRWLVVCMFHLQLISTLIILLYCDNPESISSLLARYPGSRLPVFLMGVAAGLLRLRHQNGEQNGGLNPGGNLLHDLLPWSVGRGGGGFDLGSRNVWRWKVDSIFIVIILVVLFPRIGLSRMASNGCKVIDSFLFVHTQLMIIYGLTDDGNMSFLSRFCRLKIMKFLGKISMTIYLLHYIIWDMVQMAINWEENTDTTQYIGSDDWRRHSPALPSWMYPFLITFIIFVSFLVNKWIEDPMRDCLRTKNVKK